MTRGVRSLLGGALGLALMQLVLSTSQSSGPTASLMSGVFEMPAKWLRAFIDPGTPAIPQVAQASGGNSVSAPSAAPPVLTAGLSGIPQPSGTGSNIVQI